MNKIFQTVFHYGSACVRVAVYFYLSSPHSCLIDAKSNQDKKCTNACSRGGVNVVFTSTDTQTDTQTHTQNRVFLERLRL